MTTALFWLGLPIRLFGAGLLTFMGAALERRKAVTSWKAVIFEGLDKGTR